MSSIQHHNVYERPQDDTKCVIGLVYKGQTLLLYSDIDYFIAVERYLVDKAPLSITFDAGGTTAEGSYSADSVVLVRLLSELEQEQKGLN